MSRIDNSRPILPSDSDPDNVKKISQSVKDSTHTQKTEQTKTNLDWTQPNVPQKVLSDLFKKILIAAVASQIAH